MHLKLKNKDKIKLLSMNKNIALEYLTNVGEYVYSKIL